MIERTRARAAIVRSRETVHREIQELTAQRDGVPAGPANDPIREVYAGAIDHLRGAAAGLGSQASDLLKAKAGNAR